MRQLWLLINIIFLISLFEDATSTPNISDPSPTPGQPLVMSQSASSAASTAATGSTNKYSNKAKSRAKASSKSVTNVIIENQQDSLSEAQRYRNTLTTALNQIMRDIVKIKILYKLITRMETAYKNLMSTCGGNSTAARSR